MIKRELVLSPQYIGDATVRLRSQEFLRAPRRGRETEIIEPCNVFGAWQLELHAAIR